jgi:hypothetical protein
MGISQRNQQVRESISSCIGHGHFSEKINSKGIDFIMHWIWALLRENQQVRESISSCIGHWHFSEEINRLMAFLREINRLRESISCIGISRRKSTD